MEKNKINFIIFIDIITKHKFITISKIKKYSKKKINNIFIKYKNIEISSTSNPSFNKLVKIKIMKNKLKKIKISKF